MKIFNISARNLTMISASALFLTFGSFATTSCSSDDDSSEDNTGGSSTVIEKGYKLTRVGEYAFFYNEKGAIASISYEDEPIYSFDKDRNLVMTTEIAKTTVKLSYDSKGRIASATAKEIYRDGNESGTADISVKATYSGDYIANLKCEISDEWSNGDRKQSGKATYETKFNWKNGLINNSSTEWSEKESGSSEESGNYETVYTYDNPDAVNKCQQPFICMFDELDYIEELACPLGLLGFLGNGPVTLPSSFTSNYYDNGQVTETTNLRFTFNEDGTIRSEHRITSWGWEETLGYFYAGNAARSIAGKQQSAKRFAITPLHLRKR